MRSQDGRLSVTRLDTTPDTVLSSHNEGERGLMRWPYVVDSIRVSEIYDHIEDAEWQRLRIAMKGRTTHRKLAMLQDYVNGHVVRLGGAGDVIESTVLTPDIEHHRCVVAINYINALKRGGQLDPFTLEVRR